MKKKHTHIGSYGIIINNDKILLIKKTRGGYLGKLDLPGGGIEHTESPNETLCREIKEETGATTTSYNLLSVESANIVWQVNDNLWEDLHHIGVLYEATINENEVSKDGDGIDSGGAFWYQIDSLSKDMLSPFANYAVNYYKKKDRK